MAFLLFVFHYFFLLFIMFRLKTKVTGKANTLGTKPNRAIASLKVAKAVNSSSIKK